MKKKLLNNLGLKLLSILIAILVWFLVVMSNNPKDTKRLYNIPVTLTNVELLENQGKVYSVLNNTNVVNITVEMPRDKMSELSASDIVAEADVSKLTEINTVPINCTVINEDLNVSSITWSRDAVQLSVEDKIDRGINVNCKLKGEVAEGYTVADVSRNLTRINISGPRSEIEQVNSAIVEIDVTGATSDISVNVEPTFYDKEGNLLNLSNVTKSEETIHVEVKVLAVKEVPVEVNYTGVPAEGYLTTGEVLCDPSTVVISGTLSALSNVNKISISEEDVDITGATGTFISNLNLRKYLPTNVNLADNGSGSNGKVAISIIIEPEEERTLTIPRENLEIRSLPEGFRVELPEGAEAYQLTVSGLHAAVSAINQSELRGIIDFKGWMEEQNMERLAEGTYEVPVSVEIPDDVGREEMVIQVNIVEELEEEN